MAPPPMLPTKTLEEKALKKMPEMAPTKAKFCMFHLQARRKKKSSSPNSQATTRSHTTHGSDADEMHGEGQRMKGGTPASQVRRRRSERRYEKQEPSAVPWRPASPETPEMTGDSYYLSNADPLYAHEYLNLPPRAPPAPEAVWHRAGPIPSAGVPAVQDPVSLAVGRAQAELVKRIESLQADTAELLLRASQQEPGNLDHHALSKEELSYSLAVLTARATAIANCATSMHNAAESVAFQLTAHPWPMPPPPFCDSMVADGHSYWPTPPPGLDAPALRKAVGQQLLSQALAGAVPTQGFNAADLRRLPAARQVELLGQRAPPGLA
eukprot:TRINITY_DN4368_c0_g1_i2.p1 TRINITY_DN4368_c0_g1~~TRINITY_DN4368_c0_g1_i2.p1  ORF type:complete len:325 (-),score=60.67 TRINITY_DN4368_c0_g1_i2:120-1094(-)